MLFFSPSFVDDVVGVEVSIFCVFPAAELRNIALCLAVMLDVAMRPRWELPRSLCNIFRLLLLSASRLLCWGEKEKKDNKKTRRREKTRDKKKRRRDVKREEGAWQVKDDARGRGGGEGQGKGAIKGAGDQE